MLYYATIALTVVSNVLYHVFLKMTPGHVNPVLSLAVTYGTAMAATLLLYPLFPTQSTLLENAKELNWASLALGLSIVGLEMGFLLAYRMGWQISLAGIVSNIAVALVLIPVGVVIFKETMSIINGIGLLLCLAGLILVNWQN